MNSSPPLAHQRVFLPDGGAQPFGDRPQQVVADVVAQRIVDGLEVVEIQEQDADATLFAVGGVDRLGEAVEQQGAVGQSGQRVVGGQMADVVGGDLALVFLLEQIQREGDFPGQISQQVGDIVLEEARLRRVSAQAADHFAVPAQGESRRRANRHAFGPFPPRLVVGIAEEIVADHGMAQAKRHARWAPTFRQAGIAGSGGGRHIARGLGYRAPVRDGAQPAALRVDEPDTNQRNLFECGHDLADLPEQLPGLAVAADDGGAGSAEGGVEIAEPDDFPLRRLLDSHIADGGDLAGAYYVDQSAWKGLDTFEELATKNAGVVFAEMEFE